MATGAKASGDMPASWSITRRRAGAVLEIGGSSSQT
jgi:hypothetical protein